jgi:large subunit ribosomal protein L4
MSTLKIYDQQGTAVGDFDLADDTLVLDKGAQAVHEALVAYMAAQRTGSASTLRKGEVAGSNKKPWRQKGTGRARAGYRQSPVWRGGGVAFGPHPRSFALKVNKKVARLAFRRAFSDKVQSGQVRMLDQLTMAEAKTKSFAGLLKSLGIDRPALFVVDKVEKNVARASRNIPNVEVAAAKDVNIYQLLRYPVVVVSRSGMDQMQLRLAAGGAAK